MWALKLSLTYKCVPIQNINNYAYTLLSTYRTAIPVTALFPIEVRKKFHQ